MPRGLIARGILVVDDDLAARGPFDERDQLQDAALARAGVARQEGQRAALDLERHAGQGLAAVRVALVNLVEANHAAASRGSDFNSADTNSDALNTPKSSALLADADEADGNFQPLRDGEHHAALGRAVEFGDDQPGDSQPLVEFLGLRHRILADGAVEHQQHLVRRAGIQTREHALDLFELVHQMRLGVQTPRGIGDQHIDVARARGVQGVEDDGGGLGAGLLGDDGHLIALGPDFQLLARRRAKGIAGGQHDALPSASSRCASLPMVVVLPAPLIPTTKMTKGLTVGSMASGLFHGLQDLRHGVLQGLEQRVDIVEFLARHAPAQLLENSRGGLDAHIGRDQPRLELIQDLGIDLAPGQQFGDVGGEPRGTLIQFGAQALEKPAHLGRIGFIRHGQV